MTDLPRGWAIGPLSDFITPRGEKVSPSAFPELPFIGMDHVEAHTTRILGSVPASELKSNAARFFENDVLYGRLRPYLNKVAQPKFDGLASAEFIIFGGNELIYPAFLRHRLNARDFVNFASSLNAGDRPRVNFEQIGDFEILVPPPNEQRRIVEKIEAMFDEIDAGVQSLQAARATLGLYRQSLLKSAFEGRLTADWRARNADKLEAPETLLARIQAERDTRYKVALEAWQDALAQWRADGENGKKPAKPKRPRDIPAEASDIGIPGWTVLPFGLLIDEPSYGTSKKSDYNAGSKGVLRIPNIASGVIDATDLKSANLDDAELAQYQLIEGDVLTIRSNGSLSLVGKPALVRPVDTQFVYAGYLIRLRPIPGSLIPKNLVYLMMEPNVRAQIESKAKSTSGVNNINAKELQELQVPICCPAEQAEIVRILDSRLEAADALEAEIDAALTLADALRQSILKKAFSGQLVPQNPDDEPASALLERMKVEKKEREKTAKAVRKSRPVRVEKPRRPTLTDLLDVLKQEKSWIPASKAAEGLGLGDGASSDDIEAFYHQLKQYVESSAIEIERRGDEDWLRLAEVEAN
ncbi:restriction endonuclease subunit S [Roseovarius ramblicola]|uniref:Restriction endonuclease subunit S n=1 Tax=Roseovarius ramblicola TaxID=2022336 RepID=A0ABV5I3B9_9RHOB